MIIKAGNWNLIVFLLVHLVCNGVTVNLKINSLDGNPLTQAGAGQPFLLQVRVANTTASAQYPQVKGLDQFQVRQSGFQMQMVNGVTEVVYHYQVRIDTPGTYTIGPAIIKTPTTLIESPSLTLRVASQEAQSASGNTAAHPTTFLRLSVDKEQVYVGQKVHCTLTFYTNQNNISVQSIIDPELTHFSATKKQEPTTGSTTLNNGEYKYAQWEWDIYPTRAGNCIIPAYGADFIIQSSHHFFSFLMSSDTKRIYSNAQTIQVQSLPAHDKSAAFIGTLKEVTAKIDPVQAKVGEGLVATISMVGEGNFEKLLSWPLQNIPSDLKWYESKQNKSSSGQHTTFSCEYIIQALAPGTYELPPQEIHYFDPQTHAYASKKTMAITFHIAPASSMPGIHSSKIPLEENSEIKEIVTAWPMPAAPLQNIAWPTFWMLSLVLIVLWILITLYALKNYLPTVLPQWYYKKRIIRATRTHINKALQEGNATALYDIFINFFSAQLPPNILNANESIAEVLMTKGLNEQMLQKWLLFFWEISVARFAPEKKENSTSLCLQALEWISIFEKIKWK